MPAHGEDSGEVKPTGKALPSLLNAAPPNALTTPTSGSDVVEQIVSETDRERESKRNGGDAA